MSTSSLLKIPPLRAGLMGLLSQNLILMGIFFIVPLYLQLVLGLDALETGVKMLPVSITMFIASAVGARLAASFSDPRGRARWPADHARVGADAAQHHPADARRPAFALSMAALGVGMGLLASQLGKVVQASVDASGRGEAGGLQFTGQQLGSSLGVALIGAVVLTGLTSAFVDQRAGRSADQRQVARPGEHSRQLGVDFVSSDQVAAAATRPGSTRPRPRPSSRLRGRAVECAEDGAARRCAPCIVLAAVHPEPPARACDP